MDRCAGGPVAVVYPEGVWYSYVDARHRRDRRVAPEAAARWSSGCCCRPTSAAEGSPMTPRTVREHIAGPAGRDRVRDRPPDGRPARPGDRSATRTRSSAARWTTRSCRRSPAPSSSSAGPCVRFNFRGVGASEGVWDEGRGEVDDALAVVAALARPRVRRLRTARRLLVRRLCRGRGGAPARRRRSAAPASSSSARRPRSMPCPRSLPTRSSSTARATTSSRSPRPSTGRGRRICRSSSSPASATFSTARSPC